MAVPRRWGSHCWGGSIGAALGTPPTEGEAQLVKGLHLAIGVHGGCVAERFRKLQHAVLEPIARRGVRLMDGGVSEFNGVVDAHFVGCARDVLLAPVVEHRCPNTPTFLAAEVPGVAYAGFVMGDHPRPKGAERCGIVIKRPMEVFPGRHALVGLGAS